MQKIAAFDAVIVAAAVVIIAAAIASVNLCIFHYIFVVFVEISFVCKSNINKYANKYARIITRVACTSKTKTAHQIILSMVIRCISLDRWVAPIFRFVCFCYLFAGVSRGNLPPIGQQSELSSIILNLWN